MATDVQVPEKFLVKNNTAGWVGVVKLDYMNREVGESIEPYGTVWLTELEMALTARAPRSADDNPFAEQVLIRVNPETQAREEFKMRPLTLVHDGSRYTPSHDRYVPTVEAPQDVAPEPTREPPVSEAAMALPTNTPPDAPPKVKPMPMPPGPEQRRVSEPLREPSVVRERGYQGSDDPGSPTELMQPQTRDLPPREPSEQQQSWVQAPEAPGQVLPGALRGSGGAADATAAPDPTDHPGDRFVPSVVGAQAAPQTPGSEEFAEAVDPRVGEETGQAKRPVGPPEEGEWGWAEEVGTPDAPTHETTEDGG